jgi:hypothetical protein
MIAQKKCDFVASERWCRKSLAIYVKQSDEHGAAINYQLLGAIADEQRDFAAAERWYRKSLAIFEKHGNEHAAATTYHHLGGLAAREEKYELAGQWLVMAYGVFRLSAPHFAQISAQHFGSVYQHADESTRIRLKTMWEEAGLGELPEPERPAGQ